LGKKIGAKGGGGSKYESVELTRPARGGSVRVFLLEKYCAANYGKKKEGNRKAAREKRGIAWLLVSGMLRGPAGEPVLKRQKPSYWNVRKEKAKGKGTIFLNCF